jgi:alkylation response protein AidB-like acyl-CoA dehydrogenase
MNFNFTDEQQLLSDTVQRFVREHYSFETRREILRSPDAWSRDKWQELAGLGLTALNVPEAYGGMGAGPIETMLAMNALGAGLVLEPFLASAVLAPALLTRLDNTPASAELLPLIASGERIVVVAHQEPNSRGELDLVATRAERTGDGFVLNGKKAVIVHGGLADEFLLTARTSGKPQDAAGVRVFRVPADAEGLQITRYRTFDGLSAADLTLERVRVEADALLGSEGQTLPAIEAAHHVALSALCAEAVGVMKAVHAATVEYTKNRKQFGQPISRFQVLQHRMVDMFIQTEQATSMSYLAALRCEDPDLAVRRHALSAAKALIGQAGRFVAQQAVQLHGGMGMTDELMVSHYFKRLTAIDLTWGDADAHLQRVAALLSE